MVKNDLKNSPDLTEKHAPVIQTGENVTTVSVPNHPMEESHHIMFVQTFSKDKNELKTKYFYPNEMVEMKADIDSDEISARSYCNIHGLYI